MTALEKKARRFENRNDSDAERDKALLAAAFRETNKRPAVSPAVSKDSECNNFNKEADEIQQLLEEKSELLEVLGDTPGKKPEGVTRIACENVNTLPARLRGNEKLEKTKHVIDDLELDVYGIIEHRNNLKHRDCRRHGITQLFNGGDSLVRGHWASNSNEDLDKFIARRTQEGGTGLLTFGEMASLYNSSGSGKDPTGLARYVYCEVKGNEGCSTMILSGYCPCKNTSPNNGTSYQQQRRYFIKKEGKEVCPRARFRSDLEKLVLQWKGEGKSVIVMLDANEDVYRGHIGRMLTNSAGADMVETILESTKSKSTATYFRGSRPIDAIWATRDLEIVGAGAMPIGFGVGDHRIMYIDVTTSSLVGFCPQPVKHPKARRLNSKIPRAKKQYIRRLEKNIEKHRLREKLMEVHNSDLSKEQMKAKLDKLDEISRDFMLNAERKSRKVRNGKIPFSPEASLWIKRMQFFRTLLKYWAGKSVNRGNLKRKAKRCNVVNPFQLTLVEIEARMQECRERCKHFEIYGDAYRTKHLKKRLEVARQNEDEVSERRILEIIQREQDRAYWRRLNSALGKRRGSSVSAVQMKDDDGLMTEYNSQKSVQDVIWSEVHQKRYHLAEEAPICNGKLRGEFGYSATSLAAKAVLSGTYEFGEDFDAATKRLMVAIADVRQIVPEDAVEKIISTEIWQQRWKKKREETSSSVSQLHFGHYISGADSDIISNFHALKTSLALVHGIALNRWSQGLCVMLEKVLGVKLINKLRAILLMEADFNAANKIIYGERMLDQARKYNMMPEEIFSERGKMPDDGGMSKILFYDIVRQLKRPAGLASVDAANCYDRVAHAIASMVFQAFGTPVSACESMLTAIQEMRFFLRTAFGDSDSAVGAKIHLKTQGLMQGNGAAPAGWAVVSIAIIKAHKEEGHGATFLCPISDYKHDVAGILYVDDTDLIHLNLSEDESVDAAHAALQRAVYSWSDLLIASGGSLKPEKCFFYLISFKWDNKGKFSYEKNHDNPNYALKVKLPDGSREKIQHLPADKELVTLGIPSCPTAASQASLSQMKAKSLEWADLSRKSHLPPRDLHFAVDRKFWPKVKYGLCAVTASYDELVEAMHKPYHSMCSVGGVAQSAKRELRYLDSGFYGVGFPHWGIESLIESINKVMTHVGGKSLVSTQYQMSLELLMLELGVSDQPFLQDYQKYSSWVTPVTLSELWAKLHRFGFKLEVDTAKLGLPREGDRWFMSAVEEMGYSREECRVINLVRVNQQVLFESDVFEADGQKLDQMYMRQRPVNEKWSKYTFPKVKLVGRHFALWRSVLQQLAPGSRRPCRLGKFVCDGHKIWSWRYDESHEALLRQVGNDVEVYKRSETSGRRSRQETYVLSEFIQDATVQGRLCSVEHVTADCYRVSSKSNPAPEISLPDCFVDVLKEWGHTWMWDNLQISGGTGKGLNQRFLSSHDWIYEAIREGSLMAVSDGSYIRELYPELCSAAMIMECQRTKKRITLSLSEHCMQANAYRGELIGLLAIHLLLVAFNKVQPTLRGRVHIYSDCLGALRKVEHLPPHRIPSKCRHSDILKNIMVNCSDLTFQRLFSHVKAHQEDTMEWDQLERESQLNCGCDFAAKDDLTSTDPDDIPAQRQFPLEPVALFIDGHKVTTESGPVIRYAAQLQEARAVFHERKVLLGDAFDEVAWKDVHRTLHSVPKMFQIFACKQVFDISATFRNLKKRRERDCDLCPSCGVTIERCSHILLCPEAGRVEALVKLSDRLIEHLVEAGTERDLVFLIAKYIRERGATSMEDICIDRNLPVEYLPFARSQDKIGWRRFLEGMVSKQLPGLVKDRDAEGEITDVKKWMSLLITQLLEITHGMWIYRNVMVHDELNGFYATEGRERLQAAIEEQMAHGTDDLCEEDKWLLEVNLRDLNEVSGDKEAYWLLAVDMARKRFQIRQRSRQTDNADVTEQQGEES